MKRSAAKFVYVVAGVWLIVCIGSATATISRPIYLWHPSQLMTQNGIRLIASRGVLVTETVQTSGALSLSSETMLLSTSIQLGSSPAFSAPDDDDRVRAWASDKRHAFLGTPWLTLRGPEWRNGGGFERASIGIGGGGGSLALDVFCIPLWFVGLVPGTIAVSIGIVSWVAKRRTRRLGFPVDRLVIQSSAALS